MRTSTSEVQDSAIRAALDAYTPVDHSVYAALTPEARQRHSEDLAKRLSIAAELSQEGAASKVHQVLSNPFNAETITALDALLEFGRLPDELADEERAQAASSQIRDEIHHFDRIMDLDSLREGRDLKRRRDSVWDSGPLAAAERLLTLTYERRVLRGTEAPEWLSIGANQPGRITTVDSTCATLSRTADPRLVAVADGANPVAALERLERYCGKHPLAVAIALLDYEMYLNAEPGCSLVAAASADWFTGSRIKVWSCGDATIFKTTRAGYQQHVSEVTTFCGTTLGSRSASYGRRQIDLHEDDRLVLVLGRHRLDELTLSRELSRANRKGRIELNDNLSAVFGPAPTATMKPKPLRPKAEDEQAIIRGYLEAQVGRSAGAVTLSVEVGHVHADRELGPIQERGIELGATLAEEVQAINTGRATDKRLQLEVVPMIDDDHVVNRLSYARYQRVLADKGVPACEVVLESSPLILDVACDLLKVAARGDGNAYELARHGRNLYLESDQLRIELIEDVDSDMRVGCVVYDTALTIYRAARPAMQSLFAARTGYAGDIHAEMLTAYDELADPEARHAFRERLDRLWKRRYDSLLDEQNTPYLDAYRDLQSQRADRGEAVIVLNILEDYYEPLELKVKRLAELLGIELPLDCLLFSPYGSGLRGLNV